MKTLKFPLVWEDRSRNCWTASTPFGWYQIDLDAMHEWRLVIYNIDPSNDAVMAPVTDVNAGKVVAQEHWDNLCNQLHITIGDE